MSLATRDFFEPVDLHQNELRNATVQVLASAPGSPTTGQIYFDSTAGHFKCYNGSTWDTLSGSGGGGVTSITAGTGLTGGTITTTGTIALDLTAANTWTGVITETQNLAANTSGDGLVLQNTTAATSGNQRYSPALHFSGQGWKTNSTAQSESVDVRQYLVPTQGTSNPLGTLNLDWSINGGAYTSEFQFIVGALGQYFNIANSSGAFQINGTTVLNNNALGSGIVTSSLTSVGTLSNLLCNGILQGGITTDATNNFTTTYKALKLEVQVAATSGTKQHFSQIQSFSSSAWNGSASQTIGFGVQAQAINVSSGNVTGNLVFGVNAPGAGSAYAPIVSFSSAGTINYTGGEIGGQMTATVAANATTLANDFRSYIIPSNGGTSVAVTGPTAVAGQIISIINKDATAATTGIVVPANSMRTFIYDGTTWWASL